MTRSSSDRTPGEDAQIGTLRIAIIGHGKMGHVIAQLADERGWAVTAIAGRHDQFPVGADVAIEFTEPASAITNIRRALAAHCPIVVGTTGWYDLLPQMIQEVERARGALFWAPNFSLGVYGFRRIVAEAARHLSAIGGLDVHLVETHHRAKKDAPSGTAIALGRAVEDGLGRTVPITSVRVGSVPGTHELIFDAPFEQVRLEHAVRDRRVFAAGALHAAEWLIGRHGVFTLDHLFGDARGTT